MGYTHHWNHQKALSVKNWREFQKFALSIFIHATIRGVPVVADSDDTEVNQGRPEMTPDYLCFNGVGDDGHEPFVIDRVPTPWDYPAGEKRPAITDEEKKEGVYNFCKTGHKPYDLVCVALLCYLSHYHPRSFQVSSDGKPRDWTEGLELAKIIDPKIWDYPEQVAA